MSSGLTKKLSSLSASFVRIDGSSTIPSMMISETRAEILRMVHQMADEIRALKARVEAVHAQSTSAKEATALEGLKARLGAVKTETGAEIAELAGKVNRLQSEVTTKLAKASERFARRDHRGAVPRATKAPRSDAFDASQNPGAPGAPRPLGSLAPAAKGPVQTF